MSKFRPPSNPVRVAAGAGTGSADLARTEPKSVRALNPVRNMVMVPEARLRCRDPVQVNFESATVLTPSGYRTRIWLAATSKRKAGSPPTYETKPVTDTLPPPDSPVRFWIVARLPLNRMMPFAFDRPLGKV